MSISSSAMEALVSGAGVQETVRNYIRDNNILDDLEVAENIASEMGLFRGEAEGWIQTGSDDEEVKVRRKKANNIVNDVARICRDKTGYTIVCTSRKKHTYEAHEPKPRGRKTPVVSTSPKPSLAEETELIKKWAEKFPGTLSEILIRTHGAEKAGKIFVDVLRDHKAREEKAA